MTDRAIRHVLVPIALDDTSDDALRVALPLAARLDARVTVLHVLHLPPAALALGFDVPMERIREVAQATVDRVVAKARLTYPPTDSVVLEGEPWRVIVEEAVKEEADLVVVGTHARHGMQRFFLGSVAERVLRSCPVPVLAVPPPTGT